jgi:hypothetical protein
MPPRRCLPVLPRFRSPTRLWMHHRHPPMHLRMRRHPLMHLPMHHRHPSMRWALPGLRLCCLPC